MADEAPVIENLRELLESATEGPWKAEGGCDAHGFIVTGPVEPGPNGGQFKRAWTRWGVDADLIAALRNAAPDLLHVVVSVARLDITGSDSSMALFCPMCNANTEDEPVDRFSEGMDHTKDLTDAELDLYDARQKAWRTKVVAEMDHAPNCAWVRALKLVGDGGR